MKDFTSQRNVRRESITKWGRFRGGKLAPVMAVAVRGNEGGMLSQVVTFKLDPISGSMITPIFAELHAVFVPVQAMDALKDPLAAYPGMTEVIREKLLSGNPLFGLENEGEITKRIGINPRSMAGIKKVNEAVRLGHNCAVNFLRARKYDKAVQLTAAADAVTAALISQTVLERMNGVLDPDDRINGAVALELPTMILPVDGITQNSNNVTAAAAANITSTAALLEVGTGANKLNFKRNAGNPVGTDLDITATLNGATAGNVSLSDFYNAEKMDELTRTMRQIVDENPEYGEEMVLRWAHGLQVDAGKTPFLLAERREIIGRSLVPAMDSAGVAANTMRSDMMAQIAINVPIPRTELGGIIITFACMKPDETIGSQPHPFLSDVWGVDNFVADQLALDPVPVTIRELDSDCTAAQESTVSLYTGLNALKGLYIDYGMNRKVDPLTVENRTVVWQLDVPLSVTPTSILYPVTLDHYPFADSTAEVVTYSVASQVVMQTPMIIGPTPVEQLAIIAAENIFV